MVPLWQATFRESIQTRFGCWPLLPFQLLVVHLLLPGRGALQLWHSLLGAVAVQPYWTSSDSSVSRLLNS